MRRLQPTVVLACALASLMLITDCSRPPADVEQFWKQFAEANAAWLEPTPPPCEYRVLVQQQDHDAATGTYPWKDYEQVDTWCGADRSARWMNCPLPPRRAALKSEYRYHAGQGQRVSIPPETRLIPLQLPEWMSIRTGTTLLTSLHLFAEWGLPPQATLATEADGTRVLRVADLLRRPRWRKEPATQPTYAPLHLVFGSGMPPGAPDAVEAEIEPSTMRPRCLRERDSQGVVTEVVFEGEWLMCAGRPVPARVRVRRLDDNYPSDVHYQFQVREGCWVLESAELTGPTWSLCYRAKLEEFTVGPVDESLFVLPTDVVLPEHSYTELGPGQRIVTFTTADGLSLEGKLSLPPEATGPVPVVMLLPGAGPWTFDRPLEVPDVGENLDVSATEVALAGKRIVRYCDIHVDQLTRRGVGFFCTNKRGCAIAAEKPFERVNRAVFSKTTLNVLLDDYAAALRALRQEEGVDANRIVLLGGSEGTILAPRLALRAPDGITAVVMFGYAQDNFKDTITWQMSVGPWRNVARFFDANEDDVVTTEEFNAAPELARSFGLGGSGLDALDADRDGRLTPADLAARTKPSLDATLRAVRGRDEDYLWANLLNLNSTYLREEWDRGPNQETLLKLDLPLAIFHGQHDGTCRVEGVRETAEAFRRAGKTNLNVHIYPRTNHDLNYGEYLRSAGRTVPRPFVEMFDYIAGVTGVAAAPEPETHEPQ